MDISLSLRSLRRTIAGLSLLAVLVTMSFAGVAKAQTFSDVDSDSWYYEYTQTLVDQGAVSGYDNGTFGPADYLTRAQAAKIVVLAYIGEDELDSDYDAGFSDVDADAWYAVYVNTAAKLGIVSGYTNEDGDATGEFGPNDYITRAAMAKIIVGAAALETDTTNAPHFSDVAEGAWYYDYVETAYNNSIIDGYTNGKFEPSNNVNRAEACKMVVLGETPTLRYDEGTTDEGTTDEGTTDEGTTDETTSAGTLKVAAGDEIAGSTLPKGATSVDMLNLVFTADGGDVELDGFTVSRTGVGASSDFSYLYIYNGDERLTTGKTIASDTNQATFGSLNVEIADGDSVTLTVVADMSSSATTGDENAVEVSVDSVESDATEVTGTSPVAGNTFSISGSSAGTMTIAVHGSTPNPTIGDKDAEITEFQLTAASEDMAFTRLALTVKGTINGDALSNFKLYQGGDVIATANSVSDDELVTFVVNGTYGSCPSTYTDAGYCITKGNSKTFTVSADIGATADPSDTIISYLEESTDLEAVGLVYGYGAQVTYGSYDNGTGAPTDATSVSVQGGQFTVSHEGPTAHDVAINGKDVIMNEMTFYSERNIEVRKLTAQVVGTGSGLTDTVVQNFTDIKLVELDADGNIVDTLMGPGDLTLTGGNTQTIAMTDSWTMSAGESKTVAFTCDIANYASLDGSTIEIDLDQISTTEGILDTDTNEYITNIVPSSDPTITAYAMTVRAASLSVALASTPQSDTFVKGSSNVNLATFAFSAGSAMDVTVSQLVLAGWLDENINGTYTQGTDNLVDIKNVITSVWLEDADGNQVGNTKTFSSGDATFNSLDFTVPSGETELLYVYGNISTSAPFGGNSDYVYVDIGSGGNIASDITSEDEEGNDVTETGGGSNAINAATTAATSPSVYMTISSSGTLTMAEATASPLQDQITEQNAEDVLVARLKATSTDEDWLISKMAFSATGTVAGVVSTAGTNALVDNIKSLTVKYPTDSSDPDNLDGSKTVAMSGTMVTFSDLTAMVPKDDYCYIELYADFNGWTWDGGGLDSDDGLKFIMLTDDAGPGLGGDFEATGQGSGTVKTEANVSDITTTNYTYVYRTVPTVANATSLGSTLYAQADSEVYRFTVTAGEKTMNLGLITLDVNPSGLVTGNATNSLTNNVGTQDNVDYGTGTGICFGTALYSTAPWFIKDGNGVVVGTGCYDAGNNKAIIEMQVSNSSYDSSGVGTSGVEIGAGETKTFKVYADVYEDSDTSTNSSLSVKLHEDTTYLAAAAYDARAGVLDQYNLTDTYTATGMLWSDNGDANSGLLHGFGLTEWHNGYKVSGMPVSYMTLSK